LTVGVELWGWSADEYKVVFVGFGYFFALICGALAGSFVVSRLHKTPAIEAKINFEGQERNPASDVPK